jgi:hypothetical protein
MLHVMVEVEEEEESGNERGGGGRRRGEGGRDRKEGERASEEGDSTILRIKQVVVVVVVWCFPCHAAGGERPG